MHDHDVLVASIVIPTHNRSRLLRRVLDALSRQSQAAGAFEVVVVADGCVDDTLAVLSAYRAPYAITIVERAGEGPAVARNAGAAKARADLLIFLDDDVEPASGFVAAHVAAHAARPGCVGLGPYPPAPHASGDLFRLQIRAWWIEHFTALGRPGHRFSFRDLLTGNLSLAKRLWTDIGGLDPSFARAREDLELGVRLMKRGIPFQFVPEGLGLHHEHETATLAGIFRRATQEGRSDALMALKHPDLIVELKIVRGLRWAKGWRRSLDRLLMDSRGLLDPLMAAGPALLHLFQRLNFRTSYLGLYGLLHGYWYRRGAALALGAGWRNIAQGGFPVARTPDLTLDLRDGIAEAEARLSVVRPLAAKIVHGEAEIGFLPYGAASEAWDGRHLRSVLAGRLAVPYLKIAAADVIGSQGDARPDGWRMIGVRQFQPLLDECYRQWSRLRVNQFR